MCSDAGHQVTPKGPWRGFPIRTSWDQSSVINSPRLIADSYVLLRLLMPRHPPCALKNLTTKRSIIELYRENQVPNTYMFRSRFFKIAFSPTHQPQKGEDPLTRRCSRPLCSSQTTTPSPPNHHTHVQRPNNAGTKQKQKNLKQTRHTHTNNLREHRGFPAALVSGPNSVPNDTSGQLPPDPFQPHHPTPKGQTTQRTQTRPETTGPYFIDIPPMSTHQRTNVFETGISCNHQPATHAGHLMY